MHVHRDRRATPRRAESAPPRSGRPKGYDGGATWSETALERFSRDLNRTEFTGARFSDSEWLPGAEAGRHGSDVVT